MSPEAAHEVLLARVRAVRRKLFLRGAVQSALRALLILLPLAAIAVAADQRWQAGAYTPGIIAAAAAALCVWALADAVRQVRSPLHTALALDEEAHLKDRISTALEFLATDAPLDEPQMLQVQDAIAHAERLNMKPLFRFQLPRFTPLVPLFALLLAVSFLVPQKLNPLSAQDAAAAVQKQEQLAELQVLQEELKQFPLSEDEEIEEVLKQLKEIERQYAEGGLEERDVMIELARLDEQLKQKLEKMGVEALAGEMGAITPHLFASDASRAVGESLKKDQFDEAAEKMEQVAKKMREQQLSEEAKEELARNMGMAASKMGKDGANSFSSDFSSGSKSLKSNDSDGFSRDSKKIGDKFRQVGKFKSMSKMRQSLNMSKLSLGQPKFCQACNGMGKECGSCNGTGKSNKPGGLKAGKGEADPIGDANRIDSFKQMLQVSGMAGSGPVESEIEMTEGDVSDSQLQVRDMYAEYAAIAEQAIEREEVPLSHRYHVKRYFQTIRPVE